MTICKCDKVTVLIQGEEVAALDGIFVQPLLRGASINTVSVAFGGPKE
jgi:hypothetical protein